MTYHVEWRYQCSIVRSEDDITATAVLARIPVAGDLILMTDVVPDGFDVDNVPVGLWDATRRVTKVVLWAKVGDDDCAVCVYTEPCDD